MTRFPASSSTEQEKKKTVREKMGSKSTTMEDVDRLFECFKCGISPPRKFQRKKKKSPIFLVKFFNFIRILFFNLISFFRFRKEDLQL